MPDTEIELIDKNCLISELRSCSGPNKKEIIILDCRSANDYASSHIKQSANISIPTIMLRRLKEGKIDLFSTIKCKDLKQRILGMDIQTLFVLYHNSPAQTSPDIIQILSRKLMAEFNDKKIRVVCLAGEYIHISFLPPFPSIHFTSFRKFSFIKKVGFARSQRVVLISMAKFMAQLQHTMGKIGFIKASRYVLRDGK
jgi:rhodanese-related sulfurtransferase